MYSKTFASPVTTPVKPAAAVAVVAAVTPSSAEASPSKDSDCCVSAADPTSAETKGSDEGKVAVVSPSKDVIVETVDDDENEDEESEWVRV